MNFHFMRPEWFASLIVLAILVFYLYKKNKQASQWHQWIAPHLKPVLVVQQDQTHKKNLLPLILTWMLAVFALAGPSWDKTKTPLVSRDAGRVVVFDLSLSMRATDIKPNRLSQAKYKLNDLLKLIKEGETGLVAYAGDAFTLAPLTEDHATLINLIPSLTPEIMPVPGSNASTALMKAVQLLKQGGHQEGDIIWFTDGFEPSSLQNIIQALPDEVRLFIYAFGTQEGSPVQLADGKLLKDKQDHVVITKPNFVDMQQLALQQHGHLIRSYAAGEDVETLAGLLAEHEGVIKDEQEQGFVWQDMGVFFTFLLLIPMLAAFRRGHLLTLGMLLLVGQSFVPQSAYAAMWQNTQEEALEAYQAKDFKKAAELSADHPQMQASAFYQQGAYQEAAALWQKQPGSQARYNLGNALMQQHKFKEAITAYEQALQEQPIFPEATHNLELAQKLAQQQQKQEQEQEQEQKPQDQQQPQQEQQAKQDPKEQNDQSQQQSKPNSSEDQSNAQNQQQSSEQQSSEQQSSEQQSSEQQSSEQQSSEQQNAQQQPDASDAKDNKQEQQQKMAQNDADQEDGSTPLAQHNDEPSQELPTDLQRIMQQVPDDPTLLLRNKMKLEYLKRQKQGQTQKEQNPW